MEHGTQRIVRGASLSVLADYSITHKNFFISTTADLRLTKFFLKISRKVTPQADSLWRTAKNATENLVLHFASFAWKIEFACSTVLLYAFSMDSGLSACF